MSILVTGGAGYIGAHVTKLLNSKGYEVIVIDDESTGVRSKVDNISSFFSGNILDTDLVHEIILDNKVTSIIHMAGKKSVAESNIFPEKYISVNIDGTKSVINASKGTLVDKFIFSSSAAVYGNSINSFVTEQGNTFPLSVYGKSKLGAEQLIKNELKNSNISFTSLRFFNVVGSNEFDLRDTSSENLFPIIHRAIKAGVRPQIFGSNLPTPDGTCIRDYVHVQDIAEMHLIALNLLGNKTFPEVLNLGTGKGYSVLQIVAEFLKQTNSDLTPEFSSPREGDPTTLIADTRLMTKVLGYTSKYSLQDMISSIL